MPLKLKQGIRIILGVLTGLALLDLFCAFYYNPTGYVESGTGATDLVREPGAFTSRATEGIAWARIDANGYNNASAPDEGDIFVLMMGSSHTEALNVMQDESASARLEKMLQADGMAGRVYNIGMSSHTLVRNISNFGQALDAFEPTGYVVVETADVIMYTSSLMDAQSDALEPLPVTGVDVPGLLTDRPLMRTLYRQYMNLTGEEHTELYADYIPEDTMGRYEAALTDAFTALRAEADAHGVELIIYYHPHLTLNFDGTATPQTQTQCLEAFARACAAADVTFIDMTDVFLEAYTENCILPHGFVNTPAGTGHLNCEGHRMVAEALYGEISAKEAKK